MGRVSSAPEGGKFRCPASATIDGQAGLFGGAAGFENLLLVEVDASGELVLATGPDADGVIDTTEGRRETATDLANFRQVIGGKVYTVLKRAQIQEIGDGVLAIGDRLYAHATVAGDVRVGAAGGAGDSYVGVVLEDPTVRDGTGLYLEVDMNSLAPGTA